MDEKKVMIKNHVTRKLAITNSKHPNYGKKVSGELWESKSKGYQGVTVVRHYILCQEDGKLYEVFVK